MRSHGVIRGYLCTDRAGIDHAELSPFLSLASTQLTGSRYLNN